MPAEASIEAKAGFASRNDIYKGTRFRSCQDTDQFYIRSYGYYETRQVRLNFTWKLIDKNSKAQRVRSSALEAENGRMGE